MCFQLSFVIDVEWHPNIPRFPKIKPPCQQTRFSPRFLISNRKCLHNNMPFPIHYVLFSIFFVHMIVLCKENCVIFKLTSQKPTQTFVSLQAYWYVLLKAWSKYNPCQGVTSTKGTHLTIKLKVHVRVDRLPPLSFTYVINLSHKLYDEKTL